MTFENFNNQKKETPLHQGRSFEKVVAAFALTSALTTGIGLPNAEAATLNMKEMTDSPEVVRIESELRMLGIDTVRFMSGLRIALITEKGQMYLPLSSTEDRTLPLEKQIDNQLKSVSGIQILHEIIFSNPTERRKIDFVPTPRGEIRITIDAPVREVFKVHGITYKDGIISKGTTVIDLRGMSIDTFTEVTMTKDTKTFVHDIIMRTLGNGTSSIEYKIDPKSFTVTK